MDFIKYQSVLWSYFLLRILWLFVFC